MPTPITHAFVSVAVGGAFSRQKMPAQFWILSILCSVFPDIDTIGLRLDVPYDSLLGHRGLAHSIPFAFLLSIMVVSVGFPRVRLLTKKWWRLLGYFLFVSASHGVLDAMTDGGLGIAFFSPFHQARYFLPWRPLAVSPIGLRPFLSPWGLSVIRSELLWIWAPACLIWLGLWLLRRTRREYTKVVSKARDEKR